MTASVMETLRYIQQICPSQVPTLCVLAHSCVFARALPCITGKNSIEMTRRPWRIALLHHSPVIASRSAINFRVPPSPRQSVVSPAVSPGNARGRVSSLLAAIAPLIAPRSYFPAREIARAHAAEKRISPATPPQQQQQQQQQQRGESTRSPVSLPPPPPPR